jgi:ATP-dependent DNA ligase
MPSRLRSRPITHFIEPCLPRRADKPPAGPGWIHEIKHDGYRVMAERNHGSVRLFSRNGYDFADRFPLAAAAIRKLPVRSCLIDGEAIVCDANGLAVFDLLRRWGGDDVILCAFDLLELDDRDLRRAPIEERNPRKAVAPASRWHCLQRVSTAATARSSTSTPARSAVRGSFRSAWDPHTGLAGPIAG